MNIKIHCKRFLRLLYVDLHFTGKQFLIPGLVIVSIYIFLNLMQGNSKTNISVIPVFPIMLIIGIINSSALFSKVHNPEKAIDYYMVPVTLFEKYFSLILISSLFYFVYTLLIMFFASLTGSITNFIFFGARFHVVNPFYFVEWCYIIIYLLMHSIFVCGSALFKNKAFWWTILSLIGFSIAATLFIGLIGYVFFKDLSLMNFKFQLNPEYFENNLYEDVYKHLLIMWKAYIILLITLFYTGTFFLIQEKQVKD